MSTPTLISKSTPHQAPMPVSSSSDRECWDVCRERFKYVAVWTGVAQYLLLMLFSVIVNVTYLNPISWLKEISISLLVLVASAGLHEYIKLKFALEEKIYHPTRISKFIKSFTHESLIFLLNVFIGLFTSLLFMKRLSLDFTAFSIKTEEKSMLNEKFIFILFNGVFIRCFFHFKRPIIDDTFTFPVVHQSKFLQLRRQFITVLKSSMLKTLLPTIHYFVIHVVFGGFYCYLLRRTFGFNDTTILRSLATVVDVRLLAFSWVQSALLWSFMELMNNIVNIYATYPKQFPTVGSNTLTISDALGLSKFHFIQQLAAQDLYMLADSPNSSRRNQFYALSNPGGHPHNWKNLVEKSLEIINNFSAELKKTIESTNKSRSINNNIGYNTNQPYLQFFESKRLIREHNEFSGIRSLSTTSLKLEPAPIEKQSNLAEALKQRLLSNRLIFYFFGENESAKLNFLLNRNSQTIVWIGQGISAIISRSLTEDSYGVVQQDIKQILKSFIKLKILLDKVGVVTIVAKDREFVALKAALRRSLYRITSEFSGFFEDLLLDPEDVRALHSFVAYKEL